MIKIVERIEEANCVTHSGTMHADEVFATAFLHMYLGDIKVYRTSEVDFDRVQEGTLVYDVGRREFDHHQIDALKRDSGITYSSVGLLWRKFGKDFLRKYDFKNIDALFLGIDKDFIEGIDADDNGVFPKIEANYKVKTLPNVIKIFNPSYQADETESEQFLKAVSLAEMIWEEEIYYVNGKVIADKKIQSLLEESDPDCKYLILDEYLPYEDTILDNPLANNILFVAFPSNRGGYAIKTVSKSSEDRSARLLFPEEWAGLQNEELAEVSGIKGLRFCHTGRFIVSCNTMDDVLQVLKHCVELDKEVRL